jgi:CBS domain containing-hemolysin-like protein
MLSVITITLCTLIISSVFALLETTVAFTDDFKLHYIKKKHDLDKETYNRIRTTLQNKNDNLSALAIIATCSNILGSSMIGAQISRHLSTMETTLYMGVFIYMMLIFSKIIPKIIAIEKFDEVIFSGWRLIKFARFATYPVLIFATLWIRLITKNKDNKISSDELREIIRYHQKNGSIHQMQRHMMDNLIKLKKKTIRDVLEDSGTTPIINYRSKIKKYRLSMIESKGKRFIVEDQGEVVGIAFYRDLADYLLSDDTQQRRVKDCVKEAIILQDDVDLFHAILQFQESQKNYAIIKSSDNVPIGIFTAKQAFTFSLNLSPKLP